MDINTGRYDHIEDVLVKLHNGSWFGWSDHTNKIYANLVIYNSEGQDGYGCDKPTEKELTDALAKAQSDFDAQEYARNRIYPTIGDQLDYIFHNGVAKWKTDMISPVKAKYPKPS